MQPDIKQKDASDSEALANLVRFSSALLDPDRIRIAGLLAEGSLSRYELIECTGISEAEMQKHLARLEQGGIIRPERGAGPDAPTSLGMYARFELDRPAMHALGPLLGRLQGRTGPRPTEDRARVISSFFDDDGRLTGFPRKPVHFVWILEYIVERFEFDREYPEREVNAILKPINDDTATLRRSLIDYRLMSRDHGIYRREPPTASDED